MLKKQGLLFILLLWVCGSCFARDFKSGANAVILYSHHSFEMTSQKAGVYKVKTKVWVLNTKGRGAADFLLYTNSFEELSKFSAVVAANGKEHKFSLGNVLKTDYSNDLKTDIKVNHFEPQLPAPFIVTYEYEVVYKNGFNVFPVYRPLNTYFTVLQQSLNEVIVPKGIQVDWLEVNAGEPVVEEKEKATVYKWVIDSFPAIKPEQFSLPARERLPVVYAKPRKFMYGGYEGNQGSWKDLGTWHNLLNEGRDKLPENTVARIMELTAGVSSDSEKVRVLYNYLAESTRYVSIQLGIGGYQPQPAATVDKTKFGDCKGLSNYLQAMLKVAGIRSYYTMINTKEKKLPPEYACNALMNHAILKVELPGRDIWLECTNALLPFGYIHGDIAGHDALVLKEEGGVLETLPEYPDSLDVTSEQIRLLVAENGEVTATSELTMHLKGAESFFEFDREKQEEKNKVIGEMLGFSVSETDITDVLYCKSDIPYVKVYYRITSGTYARLSANRLFLPVNGFSRIPVPERNTERQSPVSVQKGYILSDTIRITVPEGYEPETFPADVVVREKYGSCSLRLMKEGKNKVTVEQSFVLYAGEYPKEEYEAFGNFLKAARKCYTGQLVFVKK